MHATITLCVMVVGGYIIPETEIKTIPLKDDMGQGISIQDMEWKERAKTTRLPQVPTLGDPKQVDSRGRPSSYDPMTPTPRSPYENPANRNRQGVMPQAPTEAGNNIVQNPWQSGQGANPTARVPGSGGNGYYQQPTAAAPGGSGFTPNGPSSGYGSSVGIGSGAYQAQRATGVAPVPNASGYVNNNNGSMYNRQYGIAPQQPVGADPSKAFSGYQPPSGNSPWNNLYLPTNNGTTNPYTAYVRPAMDQQTFNSHISEQINGVQTQRPYQGTQGYEIPMSGPGLANPSQFIDYNVH